MLAFWLSGGNSELQPLAILAYMKCELHPTEIMRHKKGKIDCVLAANPI